MRSFHSSLTAVALSCLVAVFAFTASAQTNRATFPADFDRYVLYATYDRGSSKEEAFAKPWHRHGVPE
jgi:hypothetical protein